MKEELDTYKKEKWVRYAFWFLAGVLVAIVIAILVSFLNNKTTVRVPNGYAYAIEEHFAKNNNLWSTYYVYDNYILITKDNGEDNPIMAYDGIGASNLSYKEGDTVRTCDEDSCFDYPKVLITIKKLIANKIGREYTGK